MKFRSFFFAFSEREIGGERRNAVWWKGMNEAKSICLYYKFFLMLFSCFFTATL